MPRREAQRRAHEVLTYLELEDARYRRLEEYSTGMKQRLKLAQGRLEVAGILMFHRQAVAQEAVLRILRRKALQGLETGSGHPCATIPCEMSCPYFFPVDMRGGSATLPLGESWAGLCRATPGEHWQPDAFDMDLVNKELRSLAARWRPKAAGRPRARRAAND